MTTLSAVPYLSIPKLSYRVGNDFLGVESVGAGDWVIYTGWGCRKVIRIPESFLERFEGEFYVADRLVTLIEGEIESLYAVDAKKNRLKVLVDENSFKYVVLANGVKKKVIRLSKPRSVQNILLGGLGVVLSLTGLALTTYVQSSYKFGNPLQAVPKSRKARTMVMSTMNEENQLVDAFQRPRSWCEAPVADRAQKGFLGKFMTTARDTGLIQVLLVTQIVVLVVFVILLFKTSKCCRPQRTPKALWKDNDNVAAMVHDSLTNPVHNCSEGDR